MATEERRLDEEMRRDSVERPASEELFLASVGLQPRDQQNESSEKSPSQDSSLPQGWRKVYIQRKVGKTAGKYDAYIYSPDGRKHRSKTDLALYLEKKGLSDLFDASKFDFTVKGIDQQTDQIIEIGSNKRKRDSIVVEKEQSKSAKKSKSNVVTSAKKTGQAKENRTSSTTLKHKLGQKKLVIRMNFASQKKKDATENESANSTLCSSYEGVEDNSNMSCGVDDSSPVNFVEHTLFEDENFDMENSPLRSDKPKGSDIIPCESEVVKRSNGNSKSVEFNNNKNDDHDQDKTVKPESKFGFFADGASNVSDDKAENTITKWKPPRSPFNLIEESLSQDPWKILVFSIITEAAQGRELKPYHFQEFFKSFSSAQVFTNASSEDILEELEPFCLSNQTAETLVLFSNEYLSKSWTYPDELHGVGKHGNDAYRIFCINEWKQVAPDNQNLNDYHQWLWKNHRVLGI